MLGADHRDPVGDEHHSKQRHHDGHDDHTLHYGAGGRATQASAIHPGIRSSLPSPAASTRSSCDVYAGRPLASRSRPLPSMPARQAVSRCRGTGGERGSGGHGQSPSRAETGPGYASRGPGNDESQPRTTQPVKRAPSQSLALRLRNVHCRIRAAGVVAFPRLWLHPVYPVLRFSSLCSWFADGEGPGASRDAGAGLPISQDACLSSKLVAHLWCPRGPPSGCWLLRWEVSYITSSIAWASNRCPAGEGWTLQVPSGAKDHVRQVGAGTRTGQRDYGAPCLRRAASRRP